MQGIVQPILYRSDVELFKGYQAKHEARRRGQLSGTAPDESSEFAKRIEKDKALTRSGNNNALQWGCKFDSRLTVEKAIKAALEVFPDYIDMRDFAGITPLQTVAQNGNIDVVRALLDAGSFAEAPLRVTALPIKDLRTPLTARQMRSNQKYQSEMVPIQFVPDELIFLDALGLAIRAGHHSVAKILAERTVTAHEFPLTSSYIANRFVGPVFMAAMTRNSTVLRVLLARGCDATTKAGGFEDVSALHVAARVENNEGIMSQLMSSGADLHAVDAKGRTPFTWAIKHGCVRNAQWLLDQEDPTDTVQRLCDMLAQTFLKDLFLPVTKSLVERFVARGDLWVLDWFLECFLGAKKATDLPQTVFYLINHPAIYPALSAQRARPATNWQLPSERYATATYLHLAITSDAGDDVVEALLNKATDDIYFTTRDTLGVTAFEHAKSTRPGSWM
ncbi:Uu.00g139110.m01.CDS01 [Anthostomella pinea]|uniref:Uu.00g139110.m01.CDS01 n=1 Tax=Anthostomella pinea TaxID=933095 RepID=A0AAI8YLE0_9PEZI|nr:Uu.00g139110.m01.CDS01 [Anthostomella pinea]